MNEDIKHIKELTALLNHHRDAYYNGSNPEISDYEYDTLYDELKSLEDKTGICFNNSPTQSVGYEVKSKLEKVTHNHPMLSLDKTKSTDDIVSFLAGRKGIAMLKMDGLTISTHHKRVLASAETRGNGEIGEDVLHNVKTISNFPMRVKETDLITDGETIIDYDTFEEINSKLPADERYKNPRNLVSGSIRQLDSNIAADRNMKFIAWKSIKGIESNSFCERLEKLSGLGFEVVPHEEIIENANKEDIEKIINRLKEKAEKLRYPIDGIVFGFDDVAYGETLGMTGHHVRSQIAFKFYDEEVETVIRDVEFSMGKTGSLTPVAIFDSVEIDGTEVSRASLHNISILKSLHINIGDTVAVYKANQIIPQIRENLTKRESSVEVPTTCPICNGKTEIVKDNDTEVLMCSNPDCKGKLLGKLTHAVSKNALDIDGLSEETISTLIDNELVEDIYSIYELKQCKDKLLNLERFGKKKVENLLTEIENSKDIKLQNFIYAWSIPLIGKTVSKDISKVVNGDLYEFIRIMVHESGIPFTKIDGFGEAMYDSLSKWWNEYCSDFIDLAEIMRFEKKTENSISGGTLEEKNFCITGKLTHFENRNALVADIESKGGKFVSGVSKTTDYLINNDNSSQSSKNEKAAKLGIPVITEEDYMKM